MNCIYNHKVQYNLQSLVMVIPCFVVCLEMLNTTGNILHGLRSQL